MKHYFSSPFFRAALIFFSTVIVLSVGIIIFTERDKAMRALENAQQESLDIVQSIASFRTNFPQDTNISASSYEILLRAIKLPVQSQLVVIDNTVICVTSSPLGIIFSNKTTNELAQEISQNSPSTPVQSDVLAEEYNRYKALYPDLQKALSLQKEPAGHFVIDKDKKSFSVFYALNEHTSSLPNADIPEHKPNLADGKMLKAVLIVPTALLLTNIEKRVFWSILIFIIALALTGSIIFILVRRVSILPIKGLLGCTKRYTTGDYSFRMENLPVCNEFSSLATAIYNMADKLDSREKELIAAREFAEATAKTKSEFMSNMSHEIRTPLNAIIGMAYLALQEDLTTQQHNYVEKIHTSGSNLLRLINDILELSRLDTGHGRIESIPFELYHLIDKLKDRFLPTAQEKEINLTITVQPEIPNFVSGDPVRLQQALSQLIENTLQYTKAKDITITFALEEISETIAQIRIEIFDSGSNISSEQISSLTTVLASNPDSMMPEKQLLNTSKEFSILLAHRLLRGMNARLEIQGVASGGIIFTTTICLTLRTSIIADETSNILSNEHVLIIDSSTETLQELQKLFHDFGMQVTTEEHPEKALTLIEIADASGTPYSLITVAWRMSIMDGVEVTRRIKNELSLQYKPSVIMFSSYGWTGINLLAEQAGVDAFLHRPVNDSVLLDTIMNLIQEREPTKFLHNLESRQDIYASFAGMHVLLAEDNPVNRQMAEALLTAGGISFDSVANGEAALALLDMPDGYCLYDFVLMDLQMPVMDGIIATTKLRALPYPWALDLPVIATTAQSRDSYLGRKAGKLFNAYINKPLSIRGLFEVLKDWRPLCKIDDGKGLEAFRQLYTLLLEGSTSTLLAFTELKPVIEAYLYSGRTKHLQTMIQENKLDEATAFLERINSTLRFMPGNTPGIISGGKA